MGFQLKAYALLKQYLKESIKTEVKRHGISEKNLEKAAKLLYNINPERSIQCQYLLVVMKCLDKSVQDNNARVLNAAAYYIRQQIAVSYEGLLMPFFLAPENSNLFNSLTISLDLRKDNLPDSKDLHDMYVALYNFMLSQVYKDAD